MKPASVVIKSREFVTTVVNQDGKENIVKTSVKKVFLVKTVSKIARNLVTIVIKHQEHVRTAAKQAGKAFFVKSNVMMGFLEKTVPNFAVIALDSKRVIM